MTLQRFVDSAAGGPCSLVVTNRTAPQQIRSVLSGLFEDQPVEIDERELPDAEENAVYLVDDGEVLESSPLAALQETILLVNSDMYITGTRTPDTERFPDVITGLEDVPFQLRGYPESHKEKLLLVVISRYIEALALEHDNGVHRASFQRLSRIDDERGTRWVYEKLAESGVDTHVYGMPDWTPPPEFEVTMHGGWSAEFRDSWFVTFVPERETQEHAALVALETEPHLWEGYWTFDTDDVRSINRYVERNL